MTIEFPANDGSKEGKLLPALPGQLAMEDTHLGFCLCNLSGCAYTDAGSPILLNIRSLMARISQRLIFSFLVRTYHDFSYKSGGERALSQNLTLGSISA